MVHVSSSELNRGLSYPRSFSIRRFSHDHDLQRPEGDVRWVIDHGASRLGYTRDHGLTPHLFGSTQHRHIRKPYDCEELYSSYFGAMRPLILSLFDQPYARFPGELKPKGFPNEVEHWSWLTYFVLFCFKPILEQERVFFASMAAQYPFKFFVCAYANILGTYCAASNTCVTPTGELGFALNEIELITGLPVSRDLYQEYAPFEEEFRLLSLKDKELFALSTQLFDLHSNLAYENGKKTVYDKYWLNRRPHPQLLELYEDRDFNSFLHEGHESFLLEVSYG